MRAGRNHERGLSLVEVSIVLLVLMLLTGVLAPSIGDFVDDAKWVKAKEDCEAIGLTVARLVRDVGPCVKFDGAGPCTKANRVDLLFSDGPDVTPAMLGGDATTGVSSPELASALNWDSDGTRGDAMSAQFVDNVPGYAGPDGSAAGPFFGTGWRGAYLSPPIGPDPWGRRYLVNTAFLAAAADAAPGVGEGQRSGGWSRDVMCLSAGPNGLYETAFGGTAGGGTARRGDDLVFVVSGGSR
jgi:type II secretory pathway pseudopilin PulG